MFSPHQFPPSILVAFAAAVAFLCPLAQAAVARCEDEPKYRCHPENPARFTRCTGGKHYEFFCPSGLHFNTKTQTCDWPNQADCTGISGTKSFDSKTKIPFHRNREASATKAPRWHSHENEERSETPKYSKEKSQNVEEKTVRPWWKPKNSPSPKPKPKSKPKYSHSWKNAQQSRNRSRDHTKTVWRGSCEASDCFLPDCFCPSSKIPGGFTAEDTPMMVMLTFDDEISAAYYGYFQRLFRPGRYNPNGCPFRGAMYVSGEGTNYDLVYPIYAMGNEIACHTVSHRFPHTWWADASYEDYSQEIQGMRDNLIELAGIPRHDIKGFRVPFLQLGGDNMYQAIYDAGLDYDTSMFTGPVWEGGEDPIWPFTLDFVPDAKYCQHGPCPKKTYPGLWEVPVQRWYGTDGHSCAMPDGCTATATAEETLEFLRKNFYRYYNSNRAPLGIFVHARWFHTEHHLDALDMLIDELIQMDDVWIVTPTQVIEWMKKPTSIYDIQLFEPWSCDGSMKDASRKK